MFAIDDSNFLSIQDRVQNCSFPQYPLLINEDKSDVPVSYTHLTLPTNREV